MKKKIILVFGVRSDAIKMVPLVKLFAQDSTIETRVVVTGQHISMLDEVLEVFDVVPDYNLLLMNRAKNGLDFLAKAISELGEIFEKERPDLVLAHGDTSTSVAANMAALYLGIKVGHVEAGLRSENKYNPYPEEINRRIDDIISDYHFVPTRYNVANLDFKDYSEANIFVTGNTGIDALLYMADKEFETKDEVLSEVYQSGKKIITVTAHRRENWGEAIRKIIGSLKQIVKENPDAVIVYPVHLNPNVKTIVYEELSDTENIYLTNPLKYDEFVNLMKRSYMILTDSGGIQEEAPALGKPVLVMRENTERWEALEAGTVKVIGSDHDVIVKEVGLLLNSEIQYEKMSKSKNPYGDGKSCIRILEYLKYSLGISNECPEEFDMN